MPEGPRRSLSRVSPARIVCPALLPPWQRTTRSEARARRSVAFPLPSSPHWVPTRIMTGTVGFYPAPPCAPAAIPLHRILTGISAASVRTFSCPEYGRSHTAGNTATKGDGDMVHAGAIADWLLLTVLLGGLATASWLIYAWVLRDEPPLERVPDDVRQEDLRTAA